MTKEERKTVKAFFALPLKEQIQLSGVKRGTLASWKNRFNQPELSDRAVQTILNSMNHE